MLPHPNYAHLFVRRYRYWDLYLNEDQRLLGRSYAWLRRPGEMQSLMLDVRQNERRELFEQIGPAWETAMTELLHPSLFNECWLGNGVELHGGHGHLHLIPRYRKPIEWRDETFTDLLWGHNYNHAANLKLPSRTLAPENTARLIKSLRFLLSVRR